MSEIIASRQDIENEMKNLNVRKSHGSNEVSNWILKECREELVDKVYNIINCSLKEGKLP